MGALHLDQSVKSDSLSIKEKIDILKYLGKDFLERVAKSKNDPSKNDPSKNDLTLMVSPEMQKIYSDHYNVAEFSKPKGEIHLPNGAKEKIKTSFLSRFLSLFSCIRPGNLETTKTDDKKITDLKKEMSDSFDKATDQDAISNLIFRYKLAKMLEILENTENSSEKIDLLKGAINLKSDSKDDFINDYFDKNKNIEKIPDISKCHSPCPGANKYLEKFCNFVLESDKASEQKIQAIEIFIKELNAKNEVSINELKDIIQRKENDSVIKARVATFLDKVAGIDRPIFAHTELAPAPAKSPAPAAPTTPAPAATAAAAAAAAAPAPTPAKSPAPAPAADAAAAAAATRGH